MKKYNAAFIIVQIVLILLISWLLAMGMGYLALNDNIPVSCLTKWLPLTLTIVAITYFATANNITGLFAKRTMKKNSEEQGFGKTLDFVNQDIGTTGSFLRLDMDTGRVAYVSYQNPFAFQMAEAGELTDVVSDYKKGPANTTRYVYFQFRYKGKRMRVPTYTGRHMNHISVSTVKEGIARADLFRDTVLRFQGNDNGQ